MSYTYTKIRNIDGKLVVADTIEEAIKLYKTWYNDRYDEEPEIKSITMIGNIIANGILPDDYDALI